MFLKSGLIITINIASHELDKAAVSETDLHLLSCSLLTEQGSKCRWNARANLWILSHPIRRQAGRRSALHRVAEGRLKMGCDDFDLRGDSDLLYDGG